MSTLHEERMMLFSQVECHPVQFCRVTNGLRELLGSDPEPNGIISVWLAETGLGNDVLTGRGAGDTFVFKPNFGKDQVSRKPSLLLIMRRISTLFKLEAGRYLESARQPRLALQIK